MRLIPKADFYLDCRGVVDGGDEDQIREQDGDTIAAMFTLIVESFRRIPSRKGKDAYKEPYVVCFLCAHGVNRSVGCKKILATKLKMLGIPVEVK